jgi:hypothetical protein
VAEDNKYTVYKTEDLKFNEDPLPVPDAVVLRKKDLTVAPLMHSYSSMILSFIEVLKGAGHLSEDDERVLQNKAEWAHLEALDAEKMPHRKLPD